MKWWKISLSVMLAGMMVFLAACGDKEMTKVKVGEVTRSIFYAPQYVAISKGYFEEEGLEIELSTIPGGDKTMTALLSGGIDIALVGAETSIYVTAQGANDPIKNFAQLTQTDGTFLVSREKIDEFSWDLLKGSTFLGQRKGGMPQMVGEFVLKKHGIDPHKDLNLIQNIEFANIATAFACGYIRHYLQPGWIHGSCNEKILNHMVNDKMKLLIPFPSKGQAASLFNGFDSTRLFIFNIFRDDFAYINPF